MIIFQSLQAFSIGILERIVKPSRGFHIFSTRKSHMILQTPPLTYFIIGVCLSDNISRGSEFYHWREFSDRRVYSSTARILRLRRLFSTARFLSVCVMRGLT